MMSSQKRSASLAELSVNDNAFNAIISEIECNSDSPIPQPIMVIGEEGAGKSTLLKRLYNSDICKGMSKIWIDGRTVFSSDDIISKVEQANASIVFIDDIDFYLTRCSYEEQFRLRRFLYNEGAPTMIGAVSKVLPALADYEAPFFEGLKNVYLHPISSDNLTQLFDGETMERVHNMISLLPPTIKSVEIVFNVISLNDDPEKDTNILVSLFSNRYRDIYQALPTNSQHILNGFGFGKAGMTIPELRNKIGLPTNVLTAYLKSLAALNLLKVDKSIKRNTKYSIKDSLFQLWLTPPSP